MTVATRVIPCLDVDAGRVVKGINFEGLRDAGDPAELAASYDAQGADELVFLDITASSGGRETTYEVVRRTAEQVFIPLTVGGGVRTTQDVDRLLRAGADKVSLNTAAVARPELLAEAAQRFGSQCMVLSIEAKRTAGGGWEALVDNGREHTGKDVVAWARQATDLGAGEILLTSVDQEGTRKGFDLAVTRAVSQAVSVPVIASGGMGRLEHLTEVFATGKADAVALADALHYGRFALDDLRRASATARAVA